MRKAGKGMKRQKRKGKGGRKGRKTKKRREKCGKGREGREKGKERDGDYKGKLLPPSKGIHAPEILLNILVYFLDTQYICGYDITCSCLFATIIPDIIKWTDNAYAYVITCI